MRPQRQDPSVLLPLVKDRESFMEFLAALAEDRQAAEEIERQNPNEAKWGAPRGWQNGDISMFLGAFGLHFEDGRWPEEKETPSWRDLAEALYLGKIYE